MLRVQAGQCFPGLGAPENSPDHGAEDGRGNLRYWVLQQSTLSYDARDLRVNKMVSCSFYANST